MVQYCFSFKTFFLLLGVVIVSFFLLFYFEKQESVNLDAAQSTQLFSYHEYDSYFASNPTFQELTFFFDSLAEKKGAVFSLSVLINALLPEAVDTHLLGHFVAEKLYTEKGLKGLTYCTSDLGYACAHALVIAALLDRGEVVLDEINDICENVEGPGAYLMCFHGFGHGVLAYVEYHLPTAIELCERVGTSKYNQLEITECIGGAVMELRGGIHNPELWNLNGKKYLDVDNPLQLCLEDFFSHDQKSICFQYITPFIFDSIGVDDLPNRDEYTLAINKCDVLTNAEYRHMCYGGFAKEFISFLYGRDVRKIYTATDAELEYVASACALANAEDGVDSCLEHALHSLTKSGLYDYTLAGRFCIVVDTKYKDMCFTKFLGIVFSYQDNVPFRREVCDFVTRNYIQMCSNE